MPGETLVQNTKGRWIDKLTGKFVSKVAVKIYHSNILKSAKAERKAVKAAKAVESTKAYWKDVKAYQDMFKNLGINVSTAEARKKVHDSPKYVAKRGKKFLQYSDFWEKMQMKGKPQKEISAMHRKLEDEGYELVSF